MGKILITGSGGFIGRHLKEKLFEKNYSLEEFNSAQGDLAKTKPSFENISHVFHLAAKSFVPKSWENPGLYYETNVLGTLNILEFCRANKSSLTFVSSYVYGKPETLPINEGHPLKPENPYMHSKIMAEHLCDFYEKNYKLNITVVRPFNIFGPGQPDYFLIPSILAQLFNPSCSKIEVMDLCPKRDYLYIEDFIHAMILLFEKKKYGVYNIGSGKSVSVEDAIKIILKSSGLKKEYSSRNKIRTNEIPDVVADISKIRKDTGWEPGFSFEAGIKEVMRKESNFAAGK